MRMTVFAPLMRLLAGTAPAALLLAATAVPAQAYVGPGLGLGAASTALGVVGAILLGLMAFVWYPVKRLLRMVRRAGRSSAGRKP